MLLKFIYFILLCFISYIWLFIINYYFTNHYKRWRKLLLFSEILIFIIIYSYIFYCLYNFVFIESSKTLNLIILLFINYFISINLIAFLIMAVDKKLSLKRRANIMRIPENYIHFITLAGGFLAGIPTGRKIFNHKTTKEEYIKKYKIFFVFGILLFIFIMYIIYELSYNSNKIIEERSAYLLGKIDDISEEFKKYNIKIQNLESRKHNISTILKQEKEKEGFLRAFFWDTDKVNKLESDLEKINKQIESYKDIQNKLKAKLTKYSKKYNEIVE